MNKKIMTVLLVLAMIISMVPMAVAAESECSHDGDFYWAPTSVANQHAKICAQCSNYIFETGTCNYENGFCAVCGVPEPKQEQKECTHAGTMQYWESNGNGTHKVYCDSAMGGCGILLNDAAACTYEGGVCKFCHYQKPAEEPKCDHTYVYTSWTCNNDGTHTAKCECGEYQETVACTFASGSNVCQFCGYDRSKTEEPEDEVCDCGVGNGEYALPVDATHHNICCQHSKVVNGPLACTFNNGICVCGNKDPNFKGECHHHCVNDPKRKDDATHTGYCSKCGKYVEEAHTYVDGWCACGAQDPDHHDHHEHHKPAKPSVDDSNLDSVPKTGSVFLEWLYALIFG